MKRLLIILLMFLTILLTANELDIKELPETPPKWWYELTDYEKYELLKKTHDEAIILVNRLNNNKNEDKETVKQIDKTKRYLEGYNPFYPKWSVGLTGAVVFDWNMELERLYLNTQIGLDFYIYFLKGKFYIKPGIIIQPYHNFGGGVSFGLGVVF